MRNVGSHYILHNHEVGLIEGSLVVTAVVESQTYVDVVKTDLFIEVQVENIEVDAQHHFYFLKNGEEILLSDHLPLNFLPRHQPVTIFEYFSQLKHTQPLILPIPLKMIPNLQSLSLIDTTPIDFPRPFLNQPLLNIELYFSILNRLLRMVPLKFSSQFVILASSQHIFNIGHLIRCRFFLVQFQLQ